jgi:hypothetical protein
MKRNFITECLFFQSKLPLHKAIGFFFWLSLLLIGFTIYDIVKTISKI